MTAVVQFKRLGRNHQPPSVAVESGDPDVIAQAVFAHARRYLVSNDINVIVDLDANTVTVYAGFHIAGEGRVTVLP